MSPTLTLAVMLAAFAYAGPEEAKALEDYREVAAKAGQGPDAQVGLALWCEARGLDAERARHLALALAAAPHHVRARALLGMIRDGADWSRPEEVAERLRADKDRAAALADYEARRGLTPDTADAHWRLALWCEQKGLSDEATAHLTAVTRIDPSREAAWKRLGCKRYQGRWMTPEQIVAEKSEAEAQQRADRHWNNHLRALKRRLSGAQGRDAAELELAELDDPRAAKAVWGVFVTRSESDQTLAADLLGQLDGTDATVALGKLAVFSPFPTARARATQAIARRDARETVSPLVDLLVTPLKYEVRPVNGPGNPGVLYVEGELFNIRRLYDAPLPRLSLRLPESPADLDPDRPAAPGRALLAGYAPPPQQGSNIVRPGGVPNGGGQGNHPSGSSGGGIVRPNGGFSPGGGFTPGAGLSPSNGIARPNGGMPNGGMPNGNYLAGGGFSGNGGGGFNPNAGGARPGGGAIGGFAPNGGGFIPNNGGGFNPNGGIARPEGNFNRGGGSPGGGFVPNGARPGVGPSNSGYAPNVGVGRGGGARVGVEQGSRPAGGNLPNPGPSPAPSIGGPSAPSMANSGGAGGPAIPGVLINPQPTFSPTRIGGPNPSEKEIVNASSSKRGGIRR